MHRFDSPRTVAAFAGAFFVASCAAASAQERTVVSNSVVVSGQEASLHLEFSDGSQFALSFADGTARANDEILGRYEAAGQADQAWRELLADVLPLANGPLAQRLLQWGPSETLSGADREIMAGVDGALEAALRPAGGAAANSASRLATTGDWSAEVAEATQVEGFLEALSYIGGNPFRVVAKEDYVVESSASVDGSLVIADGRLDVFGTVHGDVVAVDGAVVLHEGARMLGDLHLLESSVERRGGTIRGEIVDIRRELRRAEERERDRLRAELRRELREAAMEMGRDRSPSRGPSFFGRIGRALEGLMGTAFCLVVVGLLAAGATKLAGERGDVVAQAAGRNPAKNVAAGLAGAFLALPAYLLGIAALAITIIGIPGLLIWVPLFPVAVVAIAFIGFTAASRNVGRWLLDRNVRFLDWADRQNPVHLSLVGIGALLVPYAAADLLGALPLVGWTGRLVQAAAGLMVFATVATGLGAVITTRGGKNPRAGWGLEDDLEAAAWSSHEDFATASEPEPESRDNHGDPDSQDANGEPASTAADEPSQNDSAADEPGEGESSNGEEDGK